MRGVVCVAYGLADTAAAGDLVAVRVCPLADLRELVGVAALRGGASAERAVRGRVIFHAAADDTHFDWKAAKAKADALAAV